MENVVFRFECDSGKIAGTGHFFRILKLYKILKKKFKNKFNYYFLFSAYKDSFQIVNKYIDKKKIIIQKKNNKNLSFLKPNDLIINDTPKKISKEFLSFCRNKNLKDIILIDHDEINYRNKYYIINGIFSLKKKLKNKKNIFQGIKYVLIDKKYSKIKNKVSKKFNLLITTGGSDNKKIIYKIYNIIKDLSDLSIRIVIGPGFKDSNPVFKLSNKKIIFIKNTTDLYPYYQKTDLSITAGGISMFESLASKNITLVTQLYKNQIYSIKELSRIKAIHLIGKGNNIFQKKLVLIIKKYQKIKNSKKLMKKNDTRYIDGQSMYRIEKILFEIIRNKKLQK